MNMYGKAVIGLVMVFVACAATLRGQEWKEDADRASGYAELGDYNAAWVFYKRALAKGCDDGLTIYRAAEILGRQNLGENVDYAKALYAVASYYLAEQSPESPALAAAESQVDEDIKRREIARTYARLGAGLPKTYGLISTRFDAVQIFVVSSFEETMQLYATLVSEGPRVTLAWAQSRMPGLLLSIFVTSLFTGIILPILMAITVAREGRKSYVSAYAFLIHWGFLGIHRFYLGRYASGLLWLFTGGLLGFGVFFDLFLTGVLVRCWNEDNQSKRLTPRTKRSAGMRGASAYQRTGMRTRIPKPQGSPRAPRTASRLVREPGKIPGDRNLSTDDFSDVSLKDDFNPGSEKF